MWLIYDVIYALLTPFGLLWLVWRRFSRGVAAAAVRERFGGAPVRPVAADCVWVHGVSLGEINATRALVAELKRRAPELAIAVSSTTSSGYERAQALYPKLTVFRFPLDFSIVLARTFERVRPSLIVLMELEAWPNLIEVARARRVPVVIANGRVTSEKSMRRFRLPVARSVARRMFRQLRWVGAQDETFAQRFIELGAAPERVEVCGSMKFDSAEIAERIDGQEELAEQMGIDRGRALWVCGSTGPGEEELLLGVYERVRRSVPDLQLALIPRKPERFDEVAELIAAQGFGCARRSGKAPAAPPAARESAGAGTGATVFLGDTLGELRKFYGLATVVFVGRTLIPLGGSDVMEIAGLGQAMIFGPHMENFAEAAQLLVDAGAALRTPSAAELVSSVTELLRDAPSRERMGAAARAVVQAQRGASERTAARILEILEQEAGASLVNPARRANSHMQRAEAE